MALLACIPVTGCLTLAEVSYCSLTEADRTMVVATADLPGLVLKTTDDDPTEHLLKFLDSGDNLMGYVTSGSGILVLNNGFALPAVDAQAPNDKIKIVDDSGEGLATGMYFQNRATKGYSEFAFVNDRGDFSGAFVMGLAGSEEEFGYADTAYFYGGSEITKVNYEVRKLGAYFLWQHMDTDFNVTPWMTLEGGDLGLANIQPSGTFPAARLDARQDSSTGAKPTLRLQQADLSEEFIRFQTTVGAGNPVNTTALGAYYGRYRVYIEGVGEKWSPLYN